MMTSPLFADLLELVPTSPAAAGDVATALRELRVAELNLRNVVESLEGSDAAVDRSPGLRRRDLAIRSLIFALQRLQKALEDAP